MKVNFKHSLNLCLVVTALALTSCGKKENKVSSSSGNVFSSSSSSLQTSAGQTISTQVSSLKSSIACLSGYRLTNDVNFYISGGIVATNKIGGQFQASSVLSPQGGQINKMWIGVSAYRDLMFVTQVMNGSTVMGFNVTLSFCEMKNTYANLPSIISNERALSNFTAPYGIIVDSATSCGYGTVNLAQYTTIVSERDPNNPYSTSNVTIPTSFAKPSCN